MNASTRLIMAVCGLAGLLMLAAVVGVAQSKSGEMATSDPSQAMSAPYDDLKWQPIVPELGKDSPQISILRVDSKTKATQLLVRAPKKIHVPAHWHSANETHTMVRGQAIFEHDGKRQLLGPGGFNYVPAKMPHEAWLSAGSITFITVDGPWDVNWTGKPPSKTDLGQWPGKKQ